jgi:hypothetical protein
MEFSIAGSSADILAISVIWLSFNFLQLLQLANPSVAITT